MTSNPQPVPFIDLKQQYRLLKKALDPKLEQVLESGQYVLGAPVAELESRLSAFAGVDHAVCVGNGTDALAIALAALDVGPGDVIFVPAYTFVATAEVVARLGATPVFVDVVPETFNMNPMSLAQAIETSTQDRSKNLKGVIPVDLFGTPADYSEIAKIADQYGLFVLSDAAQSFGAHSNDKKVGQLASVTTTSFYPTKPLGCYGDGGCILTNDDRLAQTMRSISQHGDGPDGELTTHFGVNSRLDTLQAVVLLEKLTIFEQELRARAQVADWYGTALQDRVMVPQVPGNCRSSWANYTIRSSKRDIIRKALTDTRVATGIYYSTPLHLHPAYRQFGNGPGSLPVSEAASKETLALPIHPYLERSTVDRICDTIIAAIS